MVIYDLECDLGHSFEGWFSNSDDFERQQNQRIVCCPVCDSDSVSKKLSVPKVSAKSNAGAKAESKQDDAATGTNSEDSNLTQEHARAQYLEYQKALKTVHDYVEKNFGDVGTKFTEQAIAMHTGELEEKPIRGTASEKQKKELRERGVAALNLPRKPIDKDKLN